MKGNIDELLAQLQDRSSPKRRSAAKRIRKLSDPSACIALLPALVKELRDDRTWETQYQMIMAIGECGCMAALPLITKLAETKFGVDFAARQMAVGDACLRLAVRSSTESSPLFAAIEIARQNDPQIAAGAMRAVAMMRLKYDEVTASRIVAAVDEVNYHDLTFWTAAAAAGWTGSAVTQFLERCLDRNEEWTRDAARAALNGRYLRYRPL